MNTPEDFEQEVRRIARYRWPSAEYSGSEIIAGRERDGVFVTEDCVHFVECTTSREKAKAEKDLGKLFELFKNHRQNYSDKAIKCWFVTKYEPTADQRSCRKGIKGAPENLFNIVSFAQFQAKLVDSHEYLQLRTQHKFGSIYDPKTGSTTADVRYVEAGLKFSGETELRSVEYVANSCLAGNRYTLLGEYGVGKSMTLREIYRHLAKSHQQSRTHQFPIYLNLREHQGQPDPAEIMQRHARNIGFENPSQLVRAWKAGYVVLLLDGFDEVSSQGLHGAWRRLRDARSASMAGLKRLITESPEKCGIALAGREHFFDTEEERKKSIGQTSTWKDIRLDEFTEK
jgi:AraC-like DNA-binding protein